MTTPTQNLTIHPPTEETLPSFTRLTRTILPINYGPKFFEASLHPPSPANSYALARLAIWNEDPKQPQVVAGIYGRIQFITPEHGKPPQCQLYIATLAVLAPWRGRGIAAMLLRSLVCAAVGFVDARMDLDLDLDLRVQGGGSGEVWAWGPLTTVCAHVWEVNDDGLEWYCKRGFEVGVLVKGYYRKLRPDGARLVWRGVVGLLVDGEKVEE